MQMNTMQTKKAAIAHVDYERREGVIEMVIHAVNKLTEREPSIIAMKYLGEEEIFDRAESIPSTLLLYKEAGVTEDGD